MKKNEMVKLVAVILTALAEVKEAPLGIIYAGIMNHTDLHAFNAIIEMLVDRKFIVKNGDIVTVTESGIVSANKINAAMASA